MGAEYTIWASAIGFVTPTGSPLTLNVGTFGATVTVKTTQVGVEKELLLPLVLPSNVKIKRVLLGCKVSNSRSVIKQIRLVEEREGPASPVIHDQRGDWNHTVAALIETASLFPHVVNGGVTFIVVVMINDLSDSIDLCSVGIIVEPV